MAQASDSSPVGTVSPPAQVLKVNQHGMVHGSQRAAQTDRLEPETGWYFFDTLQYSCYSFQVRCSLLTQGALLPELKQHSILRSQYHTRYHARCSEFLQCVQGSMLEQPGNRTANRYLDSYNAMQTAPMVMTRALYKLGHANITSNC